MALALLHDTITHALNPIVDVVVRSLSRVLVPLFFLGMAGSAVVVVITIVQDLFDFFSHEGENDMPTADNMKAN